MNCPRGNAQNRMIKDGKNLSGSQRYKCQACKRRYTPQPNLIGYSEEFKLQAIKLYVDGMNLRRIARHLEISPQSVSNWVNAYVAQLPNAPTPEEVEKVELDELFTFIGEKKTRSTSSRL